MYKIEDIKNTIICGNTLEVLKTFPNECVNTKPRDKNGRFLKDISYNPEGTFKKGYTWRKPKPYWDKNWLYTEYIKKRKPANQIAKEQQCGENNILYFLNKLNIPRWTMKEIRAKKYWGLKGKQNGMYGKTGKQNPNWNGGHSPERQSIYARFAWKELAKAVLKRDKYTCQSCKYYRKDNRKKLMVHHIKRWSKYPELRFEPNNLITLCEKCHKKRHKEVMPNAPRVDK